MPLSGQHRLGFERNPASQLINGILLLMRLSRPKHTPNTHGQSIAEEIRVVEINV